MRRGLLSHGARPGRLRIDGGRFLKQEEPIMNDAPRPGADISATQARQATTPGVVRWVLGVSLLLAIVAMVVAYWMAKGSGP